jgi:pimeloyl-ACP methyl ester carboxylesterase
LESADDLEDLRLALHVAKWNVYGISYGTDLALTYMRQHPRGIRSAAIDGVFPPSLAGGAGAWTSAAEGIDAVFRACRDQSPCRKRYGDIGATFRRLVARYEASPKTVKAQVPGHPGKVSVKISGGMLLQWAVSPGTHLAAKLPASIDALAHGDPAPIASTWAAPRLDPASVGVLGNGLFYGVSCGEWVPYETEARVVEAGRRAFPTFPMSILKNAPNLPFMRENCRDWNVSAVSSSVRAATRSNIPTLVISAQYDAQTAASFGAYVARTLPNSTVVTIPNVAHVAFGSPSPAANECAYVVVRSFFDRLNGADTSCVGKVPATKFLISPQSEKRTPAKSVDGRDGPK